MKKYILSILITAIVFTGIGVFATIQYQADEIGYGTGTVKDALDELYRGGKAITTKLNEVNTTGQVTLTNNTQKVLYAALFTYVGNGDTNIASNRTSITSVTGGNYTELFYSYNASSHYAFRLYKLTGCKSSVEINSNTTNSAGNIIVFY